MRHPEAAQIALFAGGDLGRWERWGIARHMAGCSECRHELEAFFDAAGQLRQLTDEMADLPNSLNWNRLAQEMTGNIRVGLAAGEAIALFDRPPRNKPRLGWNAAVLVLGAAVIFGIAFWTSLPPQQAEHLWTSLQRIRTERIGTCSRAAGGFNASSGSSSGCRNVWWRGSVLSGGV